jgi:hypothetical protein
MAWLEQVALRACVDFSILIKEAELLLVGKDIMVEFWIVTKPQADLRWHDRVHSKSDDLDSSVGEVVYNPNQDFRRLAWYHTLIRC